MSRNVRKRYVDLADGQIHVWERSGLSPAIVFLHQTASSGSSFAEVMAKINVPNRLIAIDTPGFGGSFDPKGWPSMAKYAAWAMATLDHMKVRRFHLFGHHTGASLATEIAWQYPKRAASVMMLGPVPMTPEERRKFRGAYDGPIAPKPDGSHFIVNWNYCHKHNPNGDLEIIHEEVVNMARAWKGRPQAYRAVSFHDSMARLAKLKCPILLMTSPEDFFYPLFDGVRALRPDAKVSIVGGENLPPQSDPKGVAAGIAKFLQER